MSYEIGDNVILYVDGMEAVREQAAELSECYNQLRDLTNRIGVVQLKPKLMIAADGLMLGVMGLQGMRTLVDELLDCRTRFLDAFDALERARFNVENELNKTPKTVRDWDMKVDGKVLQETLQPLNQ